MRGLAGRAATPAVAHTPTGRPPAAANPARPDATPGTSDDQPLDQEGDLPVIVSVSLVLLLGLLIVFLIRYTKLRTWQAILCILFGFYVASTPLGPYINAAASAVIHLISGIRL